MESSSSGRGWELHIFGFVRFQPLSPTPPSQPVGSTENLANKHSAETKYGTRSSYLTIANYW